MSNTPVVIAHRGASGYLPEHTLEAKALAYGLGADFLEQDVVATRDHELVVLHDLHLDDVTNIAEVFPQRRRDDGHFYVVDFDLEELRLLRVGERRRPRSADALFPQRFPLADAPCFRIATLDDELRLVRGLNRSMGRNVGIYPEIKAPRWHAEHGIDLAALLLRKLADFGYSDAAAPVFLQCFDARELRRVRTELRAELRLIQLVNEDSAYHGLLTADGLRELASYADGLGPAYLQLLETESKEGTPMRPNELAAKAHDAGLLLHPYTFRADRLPPGIANLASLVRYFLATVGIDGLFCDQPDIAVRVRDELEAARRE